MTDWANWDGRWLQGLQLDFILKKPEYIFLVIVQVRDALQQELGPGWTVETVNKGMQACSVYGSTALQL
jgi:hypothetical protein